jgi:rhodanese-related sulfurtransferase
MPRKAINARLPFLLLCSLMVLPLGGCRAQAPPPVAPAAATSQAVADLDLTPVVREFLANLPPDWHQVPAQDVAKAMPFIVDVRQPEDYAKGFIAGAVNIPLRELAVSLQALPAVDQDIVVVCNSGHRAAIGMAILQMLGYKKARSLEDGLQGWRQAKLSTVTGPVPARPAGQPPRVNERVQAALDYYLVRTLPVHEGAMSPAGLTEDQQRKSSMETEEADVIDQGKSVLMVVDGPEEFAKVHLTEGAMNFQLRGLVDSVLALPPTGATVYAGACKIPNRFNVEPKLSRFVVVSTSGHRAALGMMSMQLLGFHFVSALDGDVVAWRAGRPTA